MQMPNLHLGALLSGSLNSTASHPVTLPKVIIKYEQKDITSDIQPYLLSVSYTDYLETKTGVGIVAGVGYDITQNIALDAGYRYNYWGKFDGVKVDSHEVSAGVRVKF